MADTLKSEYRLALEESARALSAALEGMDAIGAVRSCLVDFFQGEACVVSSFGAESAVILHMVAMTAPDSPVFFIDTGKLFEETIAYRDFLVESLGLTNIQTLGPSIHDLKADDPDGTLNERHTDLCCHIRKTLPLVRALRPYKAWISGRKRHHGGSRAALPRVEIQDGKLKLNPLYDWDASHLREYMQSHQLTYHPLVEQGYPSIGCIPCTARVTEPNADPRSGRWAGTDKSECGIHIGADGKLVRSTPS